HVIKALSERAEAATHMRTFGRRPSVNDNGFALIIGATFGQERFKGRRDFSLATHACCPPCESCSLVRFATVLAEDFALDLGCCLALAAIARSSDSAHVFKVLIVSATSRRRSCILVKRFANRRASEANSGQVVISCGGPA